MLLRTPQNIHNLCIVCDVQPQYETGCTFDMKEFVQYLKTFNFVLYLFNDWKVNCPDTEESVKNFLKEKGQASDEDLKHIRFQPKVFWNFRDVLDLPEVPWEEAVKLLKMMILRNVEHANELCLSDLQACLSDEKVINKLMRGKLQFYYNPNLANLLTRYSGATNVGGFENKCNLEINLYLDALGIPYEKNFKYIY